MTDPLDKWPPPFCDWTEEKLKQDIDAMRLATRKILPGLTANAKAWYDAGCPLPPWRDHDRPA